MEKISLNFKPFGKTEEIMLTKMTDLTIKEMDSFYDTGKTMMDYFEKQLQTIRRLNPWMTDTPYACDYGKDLAKPFMAAMGLVSQSDYRKVEKKSADLEQQLDEAMDKIETHRRAADMHQKTVADQAEYLDNLKKLNEASKAQLAELKKEITKKDKLITGQEKKMAEAAKELEEKMKTISSQEKELKEKTKTISLQEKELKEKMKTISSQETELKEKTKTISLLETELKKNKQQMTQMEKDIAGLKS
jgi:myosin heavy subunit